MFDRWHRMQAGRKPKGFSLLELILVLALAVVLLGSYIAAMDEVEAFDEMIREATRARMARAAQAAVEAANGVAGAAISGQDPMHWEPEGGEGPDLESRDPLAIAAPPNE